VEPAVRVVRGLKSKIEMEEQAMHIVSLDPVISVRIEESPFGDADLREFPWKARYNALKKAYKREIYSITVEGEAVGAMLLEFHSAPELIFFEVEPRWRGKGVGQAALDILLDELRRKHHETLIVQTGHPEIYAGMGYKFKEQDQGHILIEVLSPRPEAVFDPQATACFIYTPRYLIHDFPDHPEHDGRVAYTMTRVKKEGLLDGANVLSPRAATEEEIREVHSKDLIDEVKRCSEEGKPVTRDTPTGPKTFELACLSLGGALMAGEIIEQYRQVFVLDRPPGHHASRDRAGGFCFFNNMAALALSLSKKGYRPLIIDWDVHHGNGTQELLYDLPIMYTSFHQKYLYPHTGSEKETGEGEGKGYTRNFPLPIGMQDKEYLEVFSQVRAVAEDLKPDILLISAGQDGHYLDRLSGLRLTSEAYHEMGRIVGEVAKQHCDGRVILVMEGGYHLEANAESLALAIKGIRAAGLDN